MTGQLERLQALLAEANVAGASYQMRYGAFLQMYNSASLTNSHAEMDNIRAQIHAVVDMILDNNTTLMMLTRQLVEYTGRNPPA